MITVCHREEKLITTGPEVCFKDVALLFQYKGSFLQDENENWQ